MQQPVVPIELRVTHKSADAAPEAEIMGYGFGLFVIGDTRFGRIVSHSGGYPGFGSNMRWHPGTGLGVVALTNHRYGPATPLARELLLALLAADATPVRRTRPEARTAAARDAVERLLSEWDDEAAADLFAMNVELDEPVALRKATAATLRERHGALRRDPSMPDESATAFHLAWWLIGERGGRVRVEILLSPEAEPKVQTLSVTSVPEPPAELRGAAEAIAGALATPGAQPMSITWPAGVTTTKDVDLEHVLRAMRATEARYGPVRLGACTAGDGETKATFRLESDRGLLDLALEREADGKALTSISIVPARLEAPHID
jgi:hypothetical protein